LPSELCQTVGGELFFTCHIFLEVGKTQDLLSKFWQNAGDILISILWDEWGLLGLVRASPRVCKILLDKSCVLPTFKKICQVKKEFISNNLA
jgi:hypothetical protein